MPGLGLPDLTGVYDSSVSGQLNLGTTLGAFKVDGVALATGTAGNDDGPTYFSIKRAGVNILNTAYNAVDGIAHIYSSAIGGMDIGPDPVILPNRSTITIGIDVLQFLRQDRAFATSPASGFFRWTSTLTLNAAGSSIGGFVTLDGRINYILDANPFGMGNALRAGITWAGMNGANLGPGFVFAGNNTFLADGGVTSMSQARIFFDNATYLTANSGTLNSGLSTVGHVSFWAGGTLNDANVTIVQRRGLYFPEWLGALGTLPTQVAVDIDDITRATTNIGIRSVMTTAAGRRFIEHTGSAASLFGGEVEIDGALNHDGATAGFYATGPVVRPAAYSVLNSTPSRSLNVSTVTLTQLANFVAQLVQDFGNQVGNGLLASNI